MTDPKSDPRRRCMKLENWPAADRAAWEDAITTGTLLEGGGLAAGWRETTRKTVCDAYGQYLTFLDLNGWLDPSGGPADRLSEDRLRAFIDELRGRVSAVTLRNRITNLREALRVMAPVVDLSYIGRARSRLKARARPIRNKRRQIVPIQDLFRLGLQLIRRAENEPVEREVWRAALYRDGLMILILASRPIRRSNLAAMVLDRHLVRCGDGYVLAFDEAEMKNGRRLDQPLHPALTPMIDRYVVHFRPVLLGASVSDHLWISWRGKPMTECVVYASIVARTEAVFGIGIPPHRFRDSAVTSICEGFPDQVWLAQVLLHHVDHRVSEIHYNQAQDASAVQEWQRHLSERRRGAVPAATHKGHR